MREGVAARSSWRDDHQRDDGSYDAETWGEVDANGELVAPDPPAAKDYDRRSNALGASAERSEEGGAVVGSASGTDPHGDLATPVARSAATTLRRLTVETSEDYLYDPERVKALYEQLRPDPEMYGEDEAYAVFAYLHESMFGADVFESQGTGGMWPTKDEAYDPEA